MKFISFIVVAFLVAGCASTPKSTQSSQQKEPKEFTASEYTIRPGEVIRISYKISKKYLKGTLICRKKKYPHYHNGEAFIAYVTESYFSKRKNFKCSVALDAEEILVAKVQVTDKKFPAERLNVDKKRVRVSKKNIRRVRKEQKFLNKNYASSPDKELFTQSFKMPLDSKVTSIYGSKRIFNNHKKTQHLGTDFRAPVGVPIYATNAGKVVVARDLFYTGATVTIDHGLGIFTVYGHLSKLKTVEGEFVPKGALIGLSGKSGRVTGPHLHWGVKINGDFIEGSTLVEQTLQLTSND